MANTKITSRVIADDAINISNINTTDATGGGSSPSADGQALVAKALTDGYRLDWESVGVAGISSSADATAITIDSSERIGIPAIGQVNVLGTQIPYLSVNGINAQNAHVNIHRHRANGLGGYLSFSKSRSDTKDFTIVQDADELGTISFQGADGSQFQQAAQIQAEVDGTPGSADMPGRIVFLTTPDGSGTPAERMRVDSSGNVIIGGSSPLGGGKLSIDSSGACIIGADTDAASGGYIQWLAGGTAKALLGFGSNAGAASINNVALRSQSGDLEFHTNGANERMRITSTGIVETGTSTSNVGKNIRNWTERNWLGLTGDLPGYAAGGYPVLKTPYDYMYISVNGSYSAYIAGNGAYTPNSDERLKTNITTLPSNQLDKVTKLRGVNFEWLDTNRGEGQQIGVIAQEIEAEYPELVAEGVEDIKGVNYAGLVVPLIEAIKELKIELDAAKARITELEG